MLMENIIQINKDLKDQLQKTIQWKVEDIRPTYPFNGTVEFVRLRNFLSEEEKPGLFLLIVKRISGEMPPDHYEDYLEKTYQIWLWELKDEWFLVHIQEQFTSGTKYWNQSNKKVDNWYKCDQLEGLLHLLKELNFTK